MSFSLTTAQFSDRSKTVTRRLGWAFLKPGDVVMGVMKGMGLKKGEKVKRLHAFKVVSNRKERLDRMIRNAWYGLVEAEKEGFPGMRGYEFVDMFCGHNKVKPSRKINRIEFKHL